MEKREKGKQKWREREHRSIRDGEQRRKRPKILATIKSLIIIMHYWNYNLLILILSLSYESKLNSLSIIFLLT